ncbi:MAG: glycosyltransferase family 2 protein [Bacteroidetes bacterium]|nr:glycosyltransferase family 2 protein [Bacteroidota bacterium]MBU1680336.1 glycosyltransferase family 2 protein [Bacteroidota bacterium]MBU2505728.1 glycosyltransferase family 2 protein [Bacteroidota bacterium]
MSEKLTATIITKNEEKNIDRCLKSLNWVDEIIVVDSYSEDSTVEICKKYNCKIIQQEWQGFGKTKRHAVNLTENDWILSIDADEVVSEQLREQIKEVLTDPDAVGYNIRRKSFYLGRLINFSGWNSDYPLRLFNKKFGNYNEKTVHEYVELRGNRKKIEEYILHYTYPTLHTHIEKINKYSDLSAAELIKNGKHYGILLSVFFGINRFLKMYFLQLGFLDGAEGFILAFNSAFGVFLKYIKTRNRK